MHRCFIRISNIRGSEIVITEPSELHHISDVLRLKAGDCIICCDEKGLEYLARIARESRDSLLLQIEKKMIRNAEITRFHLAPALLKTDKFDWVVQKATELGVSSISPILTERVIVRPSEHALQKKMLRWQRISLEASKQCKRSSIPQINPVSSFDNFLNSYKNSGFILMPTLSKKAIPFQDIISKFSSNLSEAIVMIGPEGDFSPREVSLAQSCGARLVSLGSLTLRSETASIYALAVLRYTLRSS